MARKMIRKAKEQNCKKETGFCEFCSLKREQKILLSNSSNSAQNLICRQTNRAGQLRIVYSFHIRRCRSLFWVNFWYLIGKSRWRNWISSELVRTPQSRKYIFPIQIVHCFRHLARVNYWTKRNIFITKKIEHWCFWGPANQTIIFGQ